MIETDDYLTATQARRLNLHLKGYSLSKIAKIEGISHKNVKKSIKLAKNKIKSIAIGVQ